eukprot:2695301-Pleurochrysis_carterae.AAC.2
MCPRFEFDIRQRYVELSRASQRSQAKPFTVEFNAGEVSALGMHNSQRLQIVLCTSDATGDLGSVGCDTITRSHARMLAQLQACVRAGARVRVCECELAIALMCMSMCASLRVRVHAYVGYTFVCICA